MDQDSRNGGWCQAVDTADLAEVLRTGTLQPLNHFVRKAANGTEPETVGHTQCVVVIHPFGCKLLFFYVPGIQRIGERGLHVCIPDFITEIGRKQASDELWLDAGTHRELRERERVAKIGAEKLRNGGILGRRALEAGKVEGVSQPCEAVSSCVETIPIRFAQQTCLVPDRGQPLVRIVVAKRQPGLRTRSE